MGIIKAFAGAVGGGLADQWLEVIEPNQMGDNTVFTCGVPVRRGDSRSSNTKGTQGVISDGSIIHVYPNQFMMLMDGGKIVDYTAEEGYYKVSNSSMPSLFNGQLGATVKETFDRFRYGGVPSSSQKVFFINLQEIKGIKFGTRNPINYFDNFYNAELFLRTHGTYSIKIKDPIKFYMEAIPRNKLIVNIQDINEQYFSEFMEALQAAINKLSADGERVSFVPSKGRELSQYMSTILDENWHQLRGMEIQSVGIASISYDEESQKLINMRNQGAMLGDPNVREGYVQGSVARGVEAAGSNANGSMAGFMGVGLGTQAGAGVVGAASQSNQQQMAAERTEKTAVPKEGEWVCGCGAKNEGKFCATCGKPKPVSNEWTCECGVKNSGKFCHECGKPKPGVTKIKCDKCGYEPDMTKPIPNFCPECGDPIDEKDKQ